MTNRILLFISALILNISCTVGQPKAYEIQAKLNPDEGKITAEVNINLSSLGREVNTTIFKLHKGLQILESRPKVELLSSDSESIYHSYRILTTQSEPLTSFYIHYSGVIAEAPDGGIAEYARGFSQTSGIISQKGVYLSRSSYWIPDFGQQVFTYQMEVELPDAWKSVSQGDKTLQNSRESFLCKNPQEEVYLIAAPFVFYEKIVGQISYQAYLRTPDSSLAFKYIDATVDYMAMFEKMIGPYPYSKFALVENFWETGYGMPSFTLLGEKIIRFPFIIYSSYPHELLHNYWGNSVYVDYQTGNWCEGITAYMADHNLKEQQGQGAEYRRTTLQKFSDFVNENNDFPLNQFLSRNNPAEEAIGYGKCLMMNHALRNMVGDSLFLESYRHFYAQNKFRKASFNDINYSFDIVTGQSHKAFFEQWTSRKGAPSIEIAEVEKVNKDIWTTSFTLMQTQKENVFDVQIPVAFYFSDRIETKVYALNSRSEKFSFTSQNEVLRIEVDPQFDVFRQLHPLEVPATISQLIGSEHLLIILPASDSLKAEYETMAKIWKESADIQGYIVEIREDNQLKQLPQNASIWVLGRNNKFYTEAQPDILGEISNPASVIFAKKPKENPETTIGFISLANAAAGPRLTKLLPHYGKYSLLVFDAKNKNIIKDIIEPQWSPLHYYFENESSKTKGLKLEPHNALTE